MLKRIYESASCKRKKAIAKADALRAVTEEDETNNPLFSVPEGSTPEVATNPECRSRLRQDPTIFWTRRRSQKFVRNRTRSHFSLAVAGVRVVFIYGIF